MCICFPVSTSLLIDAPAETIWRILMDTQQYSQWADIEVSGFLQEGETVAFKSKSSRSSELALVTSCSLDTGLTFQTTNALNRNIVSFKIRRTSDGNKCLVVYTVTAVYPLPFVLCLLCSHCYLCDSMERTLQSLKRLSMESSTQFRLPNHSFTSAPVVEKLKELYLQKKHNSITEEQFNTARAQILGLEHAQNC